MPMEPPLSKVFMGRAFGAGEQNDRLETHDAFVVRAKGLPPTASATLTTIS
jgi:hypothetical protein